MITVTKPPAFLDKYNVGDHRHPRLIVLIIAGVLWRRAVIRARKDVRGLVATLRRDGVQLGRELRRQSGWSEMFTFIIRDEDCAEPPAGAPAAGILGLYQVRRAGAGVVRLMTPTRPAALRGRGRRPRAEPWADGLELAFRDTAPNWRVRAASPPETAARRRPAHRRLGGSRTRRRPERLRQRTVRRRCTALRPGAAPPPPGPEYPRPPTKPGPTRRQGSVAVGAKLI